VSTQVDSSIVAERLPAMCGSDTLTTVVSSTSMNVANMTAIGTIHGLRVGCSLSIVLLRVDGGGDGHARTQRAVCRLLLVEHDLDRHALHHLHIVAGRVLGRQHAELGAGGTSNALDLAQKLAAAERIDRHA